MKTTSDLKDMRQKLKFCTLNLLFKHFGKSLSWLFHTQFLVEKNALAFTVASCELWLETMAGYYDIVSKYNTKCLGKNYDLPILSQAKAIHLLYYVKLRVVASSLDFGLSITYLVIIL